MTNTRAPHREMPTVIQSGDVAGYVDLLTPWFNCSKRDFDQYVLATDPARERAASKDYAAQASALDGCTSPNYLDCASFGNAPPPVIVNPFSTSIDYDAYAKWSAAGNPQAALLRYKAYAAEQRAKGAEAGASSAGLSTTRIAEHVALSTRFADLFKTYGDHVADLADSATGWYTESDFKELQQCDIELQRILIDYAAVAGRKPSCPEPLALPADTISDKVLGVAWSVAKVGMVAGAAYLAFRFVSNRLDEKAGPPALPRSKP